MKINNCKAGALVKPIKGDKNRLGVVKSVEDKTATVLFSRAGSDEVKEVAVEDLNDPNVTDKFINELVSLNQ